MPKAKRAATRGRNRRSTNADPPAPPINPPSDSESELSAAPDSDDETLKAPASVRVPIVPANATPVDRTQASEDTHDKEWRQGLPVSLDLEWHTDETARQDVAPVPGKDSRENLVAAWKDRRTGHFQPRGSYVLAWRNPETSMQYIAAYLGFQHTNAFVTWIDKQGKSSPRECNWPAGARLKARAASQNYKFGRGPNDDARAIAASQNYKFGAGPTYNSERRDLLLREPELADIAICLLPIVPRAIGTLVAAFERTKKAHGHAVRAPNAATIFDSLLSVKSSAKHIVALFDRSDPLLVAKTHGGAFVFDVQIEDLGQLDTVWTWVAAMRRVLTRFPQRFVETDEEKYQPHFVWGYSVEDWVRAYAVVRVFLCRRAAKVKKGEIPNWRNPKRPEKPPAFQGYATADEEDGVVLAATHTRSNAEAVASMLQYELDNNLIHGDASELTRLATGKAFTKVFGNFMGRVYTDADVAAEQDELQEHVQAAAELTLEALAPRTSLEESLSTRTGKTKALEQLTKPELDTLKELLKQRSFAVYDEPLTVADDVLDVCGRTDQLGQITAAEEASISYQAVAEEQQETATIHRLARAPRAKDDASKDDDDDDFEQTAIAVEGYDSVAAVRGLLGESPPTAFSFVEACQVAGFSN